MIGCAVDLCEPRMDGPNEGEYCDLDRKRDVEVLDQNMDEHEMHLSVANG